VRFFHFAISVISYQVPCFGSVNLTKLNWRFDCHAICRLGSVDIVTAANLQIGDNHNIIIESDIPNTMATN